jgi:hypothetical protein
VCFLPLVSSDRERIESYRKRADLSSRAMKMSVKLMRFSHAWVLEEQLP